LISGALLERLYSIVHGGFLVTDQPSLREEVKTQQIRHAECQLGGIIVELRSKRLTFPDRFVKREQPFIFINVIETTQ
jgi:hypothetical protein